MVRGEPEFGHQMDAAGQETGSIAPKPSGGSISPHANFLLVLQPGFETSGWAYSGSQL
jgi:hypothetical protein